jgi:hypothetical protein
MLRAKYSTASKVFSVEYHLPLHVLEYVKRRRKKGDVEDDPEMLMGWKYLAGEYQILCSVINTVRMVPTVT